MKQYQIVFKKGNGKYFVEKDDYACDGEIFNRLEDAKYRLDSNCGTILQIVFFKKRNSYWECYYQGIGKKEIFAYIIENDSNPQVNIKLTLKELLIIIRALDEAINFYHKTNKKEINNLENIKDNLQHELEEAFKGDINAILDFTRKQ